jgi:hypothetical protein
MPAEGGDIRTVFQSDEMNVPFGLEFIWAPGNRGFLFVKRWGDGDIQAGVEFWYVPSFDKPEPRMLDLKIKGGSYLPKASFNPDGKSIAFQTRSESISNVWVLENFIPTSKTEKR